MPISIDSLQIGQKYIFQNQNVVILKLIKIDGQPNVLFEYKSENNIKKSRHFPASVFVEFALKDYRNDPYYEGIYPYILTVESDNPEKEAHILNTPVRYFGIKKPLKSFIRKLIKVGFRPASYRGKRGLFFKDKFISEESITQAGMRYAIHLSSQKGWNENPIKLPDFYLAA